MATNQLSGTIYYARNGVLKRVTVQAFDLDFRKHEKLGQTNTVVKGNYTISYKNRV